MTYPARYRYVMLDFKLDYLELRHRREFFLEQFACDVFLLDTLLWSKVTDLALLNMMKNNKEYL